MYVFFSCSHLISTLQSQGCVDNLFYSALRDGKYMNITKAVLMCSINVYTTCKGITTKRWQCSYPFSGFNIILNPLPQCFVLLRRLLPCLFSAKETVAMPTEASAAAGAGLEWSRGAGGKGRLGALDRGLRSAHTWLGRCGRRRGEGPGGRLWSGFRQSLPLRGPVVFLTSAYTSVRAKIVSGVLDQETVPDMQSQTGKMTSDTMSYRKLAQIGGPPGKCLNRKCLPLSSNNKLAH